MRTVHKFPLLIESDNRIEMDATAGILHVGLQGMVTIWCVVDPDAQKTLRTFRVFGTGHPIPDDYLPVGTCFDGPFVWHVFERFDCLSPSRSEK